MSVGVDFKIPAEGTADVQLWIVQTSIAQLCDQNPPPLHPLWKPVT